VSVGEDGSPILFKPRLPVVACGVRALKEGRLLRFVVETAKYAISGVLHGLFILPSAYKTSHRKSRKSQ